MSKWISTFINCFHILNNKVFITVNLKNKHLQRRRTGRIDETLNYTNDLPSSTIRKPKIVNAWSKVETKREAEISQNNREN